MKLRIPLYSTERFTFSQGVFVSEASSLNTPMFSRVWDDAADEGFNLVNPATKKSVTVTLTKVLRNADNDIVSWEFRPQEGTWIVKVFNT